MDKLNAKELLKGFDMIQKQINNLMKQTLTPEVMAKLTPDQLAQVKGMRKKLKSLGKKDLNKNSEIFKNL